MAHRYYWLKFSSDFFYGENSKLYIDKLRATLKSQGDTCIVIFLKMMLLSLNTGGILEYKGIFPTFEEELANTLSEDINNVKLTVSFFITTPFLEPVEEGQKVIKLFIPYVVENTGSKTDSAIRMEKSRAKAKIASQNCKLLEASQCDNNVTLDNRGLKEIDIFNLKELSQCDAPKKAYGYHRNIYLTDDQYAYLCNVYVSPEAILNDVSYWVKQKDAHPSNYFNTILKFIESKAYVRKDDPERLRAIEEYRLAEERYLQEGEEARKNYVPSEKTLERIKRIRAQKKDDIEKINDLLNDCFTMIKKEEP